MEKEKFLEPYEAAGYKVIDSFTYDKIKEFIVRNNRHKKILGILFVIASFLLIFILGFVIGIVVDRLDSGADANFWLSVGWGVGAALVGCMLLVPLHELLHWLAYYGEGATDVRLGAHWKSFVFYASAHNFAAKYNSFRRVALTPFIILLLLLLLLLLFPLPLWAKLSTSVVLLFHLLSCSGDFALLSYMSQYKYRDVITVDDVDNRCTYFMERVK